jgi:hypothetical protein
VRIEALEVEQEQERGEEWGEEQVVEQAPELVVGNNVNASGKPVDVGDIVRGCDRDRLGRRRRVGQRH